jgi:hypothetical protein
MKSKFIYLLFLPLILAISCSKNYYNPDTDPNNKGYPLGTFTGNFVSIHKRYRPTRYDTTTAALNLTLSTNTGFNVTGDTATLHAGSYGSFSEDFVNMAFYDITYPIIYKPKKAHLSGFYTYIYDGVNLKIASGVQSDTLTIFYYFKKTN